MPASRASAIPSHPTPSEELLRLIEQEVPGWLDRAARRTRRVRLRKRFDGPGIWSEVKGVSMSLQHHKCACCERYMAEGLHANIEYDVEHFRPKNRVAPWPDNETARGLRIRYKVNSGAAKGYPLLAHDPRKYAMTCKVCNTPLKADHFPIDGKPSDAGSDIIKLDEEERAQVTIDFFRLHRRPSLWTERQAQELIRQRMR